MQMNNIRKNNFQSPVPKFTFSKDLDEQKIELQNNSIIERFSLSRKNLSKDIAIKIVHPEIKNHNYRHFVHSSFCVFLAKNELF